MTDIPGCAQVGTDRDAAGHTMRLTEAGAIRTFTDVLSGKIIDLPALRAIVAE